MRVKGVTWVTQNCSKDDSLPPHLTINSLHVDMERDDIRVVPAVADREAQVQSIPEMGAQNKNFIAGINGGYVFCVDRYRSFSIMLYPFYTSNNILERNGQIFLASGYRGILER